MVLDRGIDPPALVPREVYGDIDFNELNFGDFIGEVDVEGIKHVSADAVRDRSHEG